MARRISQSPDAEQSAIIAERELSSQLDWWGLRFCDQGLEPMFQGEVLVRSQRRMVRYGSAVLLVGFSLGAYLLSDFEMIHDGELVDDWRPYTYALSIPSLVSTAVTLAINQVGRCRKRFLVTYEKMETTMAVHVVLMICTLTQSSWRIQTLVMGTRVDREGRLGGEEGEVTPAQDDTVALLALLIVAGGVHMGMVIRARFAWLIDLLVFASAFFVAYIEKVIFLEEDRGAAWAGLIFRLTPFTAMLVILWSGHVQQEHVMRVSFLRRLQERSKERELMAITFHELRNPLNGTVGHLRLAQLMLHGRTNAPPRASLDLSQLANDVDASLLCTEQALHFLETLSTIHRTESGVMKPTNQPFRPHDVLQAAATIVKPQMQSGVELKLEPGVPEDLWVLGDRTMLLQILTNLLQNAARFTSSGVVLLRGDTSRAPCERRASSGRGNKDSRSRSTNTSEAAGVVAGPSHVVLVGREVALHAGGAAAGAAGATAIVDEQHFTFTVSDTGCGLSDEVKETLFDRYKSVGGIGLGMYLTKFLLQDVLNSKLLVESPWAADKSPGTSFSFTLKMPLAEATVEGGGVNYHSVITPASQAALPQKADPAVPPRAPVSRAASEPSLSLPSVPPDATAMAEGGAKPDGGPVPDGVSAARASLPSGMKVLVADDMRINRALLARALGSHCGEGWTVVQVETGEQALERACAERFDLVVLDEVFSQDPQAMLGSTVARRLREHEKLACVTDAQMLPAAIISCTGNLSAQSEASERARFFDCGSNLLWTKPFPSFTDGHMQRCIAELLADRKRPDLPRC